MAIVYTDWVGESTPTTGDGDITLGGALRGFAPMNASGGAGQIYYTIVDGEDRETGVGNYDGEVTFQRTTVFATLTGGVYTPSGARLNLSGSAQIYGTINSGVMESIFDALAQNDISFDELYLYIDDQISDVNQAITSLDNQVNTRIDNLTPADIGAANQSHTHTPAEVGMDDLIANTWITLAAPAGAVAGTYYPVIVYLDTGTAGGDVNIHTQTGSSTIPINYNSFVGKIGAGGFTDRGNHINGEYFRYTAGEIGISCVAVPTDSADAAVFYVAGNAFPVSVMYNSGNPIPKTAASIVHGTSTFNSTTTAYATAGTNVVNLMAFDQGNGRYSRGDNYDYGVNKINAPSTTNIPLLITTAAGKGNRILAQTDGVNRWYVGVGTDGINDVYLYNYSYSSYIALQSDRASINKKIYAPGAELSESLTIVKGSKITINADGESVAYSAYNSANNISYQLAFYAPESGSGDIALFHYDSAGSFRGEPFHYYSASGEFAMRYPRSLTLQGTEIHSLTRKDYVDAQIATRAATSHTHTATQVDAATRNCNFAAKLDNVRALSGSSAPTLPGVWSVENSTWTPQTYGTLFVTTNRADESTTPGSGTFIHYLFIGHNERLYTATNVNGVMSAWAGSYDSLNKPTAADGNADIVASSYGQIGTYGLMGVNDSGSIVSVGATIAASRINWGSAGGGVNGSPSGSWKCLGYSHPTSTLDGGKATLFIRVA